MRAGLSQLRGSCSLLNHPPATDPPNPNPPTPPLKTLASMNAHLGGLFLVQPWMVQLLTQDMETGAVGDLPPSTAERLVEAMQLSRQQVGVGG